MLAHVQMCRDRGYDIDKADYDMSMDQFRGKFGSKPRSVAKNMKSTFPSRSQRFLSSHLSVVQNHSPVSMGVLFLESRRLACTLARVGFHQLGARVGTSQPSGVAVQQPSFGSWFESGEPRQRRAMLLVGFW
jgi:hypothetical protein